MTSIVIEERSMAHWGNKLKSFEILRAVNDLIVSSQFSTTLRFTLTAPHTPGTRFTYVCAHRYCLDPLLRRAQLCTCSRQPLPTMAREPCARSETTLRAPWALGKWESASRSVMSNSALLWTIARQAPLSMEFSRLEY